MRQKGFSLVELMIALTLSLIVVSGALSLFASSMTLGGAQRGNSRLNHELRTLMTQITRDVRRAGHNNWMGSLPPDNNFLAQPNIPVAADFPVASGSTVAVRYDLDSDANAAAEANESFEYRWADTNGDTYQDAIETRIGGTAGAWSSISNPDAIRIANFQVTNRSATALAPAAASNTTTVPLYEIEIRGVLVSSACPPPNCMTGQTCPAACTARTLRETVRVRNPVVVPNP